MSFEYSSPLNSVVSLWMVFLVDTKQLAHQALRPICLS
jgi:hypothetical protein